MKRRPKNQEWSSSFKKHDMIDLFELYVVDIDLIEIRTAYGFLVAPQWPQTWLIVIL